MNCNTSNSLIKTLLLLLFFSCSIVWVNAQKNATAFEKNNNHTATYQETIDYYQQLVSGNSRQVQFKNHGSTDSGHPLHTIVIDLDGDFTATKAREKGKSILFINNAIHPGESCGVDASMMFVRNCLKDRKLQKMMTKTVIVVIPFYNIGGGLNRGSHSRANQNGPTAHGFRGNARNYDLNRDFVKCDTKNAQTFNQIYTQWLPDVFIDNHTSNGADYPYTMTMIATQHNKLSQPLAKFMDRVLMPDLYTQMAARNWEMSPYVYARSTPDEGIAAFLDLPRYSSGYAALHNAISFMPETHMLKPYKDRVESTYTYMLCMLEAIDKHRVALQKARQEAIEKTKNQFLFDLNWEMDTAKPSKIKFKGYEAKYKKSEVSGQDRLYYDHDAPYEKEIPYIKNYKSTLKIKKPVAYIIPQAYTDIVDRLKWNGVEVKQLANNQTLNLEMYRIKDFETTKTPYEGHYLHSDITVTKKTQDWTYQRGDYVVFVNQAANRYIVETLEPQAPDSFFAWNFFDSILMQKEHFSAYVFEDLAAEYLKKDPKLKARLEAKKAKDKKFAENANAQLDFVYKNSPHYEPTHRLYPIGRMMKEQDLKVK